MNVCFIKKKYYDIYIHVNRLNNLIKIKNMLILEFTISKFQVWDEWLKIHLKMPKVSSVKQHSTPISEHVLIE